MSRIRLTLRPLCALRERRREHMEKLPVRLLLAASVLLVLAGALWGLLAQWPCAALSWVGAIGCGAAAALHFSGDEK